MLAALCKIDSTAVAGHGAILFQKLGVSLTVFQDESDDVRAVTAFSKGQWDDLIPSMKSFRC